MIYLNVFFFFYCRFPPFRVSRSLSLLLLTTSIKELTAELLRTILGCEGAFVSVACFRGIPSDTTIEFFQRLPLLIPSETWKEAVALWQKLSTNESESKSEETSESEAKERKKDQLSLSQPLPPPSSFRVSVKRGGKHSWTSPEAAGAIGAALLSDDFRAKTGIEWKVDLTNYDLEVRTGNIVVSIITFSALFVAQY